jgi:hypothetical protein
MLAPFMMTWSQSADIVAHIMQRSQGTSELVVLSLKSSFFPVGRSGFYPELIA